MAVKFEYTGKMSDGWKGWDETSSKKITFEIEDNDMTVPELLDEFMNFLQGIGYKFDIGDRLDVVNDFNDEEDSSDDANQFNTSNTGEELIVTAPTTNDEQKDPY